MGSATRGALAKALAVLDAEKGVTLSTGEQLLGAARALAGSAQLRSVLADPAIEPAEKSTLIARVFSGADQAAGKVLGSVAESRWSDSDQLVDGVEELGIRALASTAVELEGELFAVGRAVASDAELELALGSKLGDPAQKAQIVERLLARKAAPATVAILSHLVQSPRGRRIGELVARAAELAADASDRLVATVTSAAPLSAAQLKKLSDGINARYGREARVDVRVDPAVIGGLRVQVGDEIIDGTVSTRLADLRLQLAG